MKSNQRLMADMTVDFTNDSHRMKTLISPNQDVATKAIKWTKWDWIGWISHNEYLDDPQSRVDDR